MKKKIKIVLIVTASIIVLCLLVGAGFFYRFNSETKKMHPVGTGNIVSDIYAIKDEFVNMYLIKDSNQYIAIDAGKDTEVVSEELRKLHIEAEKVVAVMLTHTDMDHVAGLALFKNARIYLSKQEELMLTGKKQKIPFVSNKICRNDYSMLDDRQILKIGNVKIVGILTEGHTSGSMCYLVNEKYLFTGDILSLKAEKIGPFVRFFDLDHGIANKSISKITGLPGVEYLFTAHHGYTKDYQHAVKDWKE